MSRSVLVRFRDGRNLISSSCWSWWRQRGLEPLSSAPTAGTEVLASIASSTTPRPSPERGILLSSRALIGGSSSSPSTAPLHVRSSPSSIGSGSSARLQFPRDSIAAKALVEHTAARGPLHRYISSAHLHRHHAQIVSGRRSYCSSASNAIRYDRDLFTSASPLPYTDPIQYASTTSLLWVIPGDLRLFGEHNPSREPETLLRERGQVFCQSLIEDIDRLHLEGYTLCKPLSPDDLSVSALGRLEIKHGVWIRQGSDPGLCHLDWCGTSFVLRYLLALSVSKMGKIQQGESYRVPTDFLHCCRLMEKPGLPKGYLLVNNACFIPHHERLNALLQAHDYLMHELSYQEASPILDTMPHAKDWPQVLEGNWLLQMWFKGEQNPDGTFPAVSGGKFVRCQRVLSCHVYDHLMRAVYSKDQLIYLLHAKTPLVLPHIYHKIFDIWGDTELMNSLAPHQYIKFASNDWI